MNTLKHHNNIANGFNRINSAMTGLQYEFEQVAPITDLDKGQIDVFIAAAQQMIAAAQALKQVAYDPTPSEDPLA